MLKHNCQETGEHQELLYICSRCGGCYVCKHKAVYFQDAGEWMWKCKDGKFRAVINDARLSSGASPNHHG